MNQQLEDGSILSGCHIFHIVQSNLHTSSLDNQERILSESYCKEIVIFSLYCILLEFVQTEAFILMVYCKAHSAQG